MDTDPQCSLNKDTKAKLTSNNTKLADVLAKADDPYKTPVLIFEGYNTVAHANPETNNYINATTRAISSAAAACGDESPPTFKTLERLAGSPFVSINGDKCVIYYTNATTDATTKAQREANEARCAAEALARNRACVISIPRTDATTTFNIAGLRVSTVSYSIYSTPPITVCLKSNKSLVTIPSSSLSEGLHYYPAPDGSCDTPTTKPITVCLKSNKSLVTILSSSFNSALHYYPAPTCDSGSGSSGSGPVSGPGSGSSGSGPVSGPGSGSSGSGPVSGPGSGGYGSGGYGSGGYGSGSTGTPSDTGSVPDYSEWPDAALDPDTNAPWAVTVKVTTNAPTYYIANGKKTTLYSGVEVLCGTNQNPCTYETHGITFSSPVLRLTQRSTDSKYVACSSPTGTKCAYYAPQSGQPLAVPSRFDVSFYTPLPVSAYTLTEVVVSINVSRTLTFDDGRVEELEVDDPVKVYYVNNSMSSNSIMRKVLGSRG